VHNPGTGSASRQSPSSSRNRARSAICSTGIRGSGARHRTCRDIGSLTPPTHTGRRTIAFVSERLSGLTVCSKLPSASICVNLPRLSDRLTLHVDSRPTLVRGLFACEPGRERSMGRRLVIGAVLAIAVLAFTWFSAEEQEVPVTGRAQRVAMSDEQQMQ